MYRRRQDTFTSSAFYPILFTIFLLPLVVLLCYYSIFLIFCSIVIIIMILRGSIISARLISSVLTEGSTDTIVRA
jgi:hypothetical protein